MTTDHPTAFERGHDLGIKVGKAEGMMAERAAIVAWLRANDSWGDYRQAADRIETGEHLSQGSKGR